MGAPRRISVVGGGPAGCAAALAEGHVREHVLEAPTAAQRSNGAQELIDVLRAYLK